MQVDTTTCDANASLKPTMFIQVQWLNQFGPHLSVFYMFVTLNCVDPQFKSMFVAEVNEIHHNLTLFFGLQHPCPDLRRKPPRIPLTWSFAPHRFNASARTGSWPPRKAGMMGCIFGIITGIAWALPPPLTVPNCPPFINHIPEKHNHIGGNSGHFRGSLGSA
jgi:hypothetical protein